jgi:hypothetical protein
MTGFPSIERRLLLGGHQGQHTTYSAPSPRDYLASCPGARRYWRVSVNVPVATTGQSTVAYVP